MCLGLFLKPRDTATHGKVSRFFLCDPISGQGFFHTIPIEKSCMCMDSPSLDLCFIFVLHLQKSCREITAFGIFSLWEQRSSKAKESLVSIKDLP